MRIAIITPGFSASESDWCIPAVLNLVRSLAARHEVHVFALRYPHVNQTYRVYGATVRAFGAAQSRGWKRIRLLSRALSAIVSAGRRTPFDVVHGLWAHEPGFLAAIAGRRLGVPAVVSLLGGELVGLREIGYGGRLNRTNWWLTRRALRGARYVTAGSGFLVEQARDVVPADRLRTMPLGVDTMLFSPHHDAGEAVLSAGAPALLHAASLLPVKDHATLLRALSLALPHLPEVHLHLVGEGELGADLTRLVHDLRLDRHVTFHGAVAHHRLPRYYRAADVCVLPSRHESQGMVTLEAAACGRTTIGTAVGVLPELTPSAVTVPVGDARALADAIVTTTQDVEGLRARSRAINELVSKRYSVDRTSAETVTLYEDAARHSG